jgi:hypothetical protein
MTPRPGLGETSIFSVSSEPGSLKRVTARGGSREDGITPAAGGGGCGGRDGTRRGPMGKGRRRR